MHNSTYASIESATSIYCDWITTSSLSLFLRDYTGSWDQKIFFCQLQPMGSQLVMLLRTLSLLSRLVCAVSLIGSDLDFTAPLEDDSLFLLSGTISSPVESDEFELFMDSSPNSPALPALNQVAPLFPDETMLAQNLASHSVSEGDFLLDQNFAQLADPCSKSVNPPVNQGTSNSRIKRLDFASGSCSNEGLDDLDLSKVDPTAADLLWLFRAEREQELSRAMQDREQNTLCYLLTAGILPWGVCYGGFLGLDDISVNNAPLQTSWAFWHTVTISQVTYGMRGTISMNLRFYIQVTPNH